MTMIRVRAIISGVNGLPGLMTAYFQPALVTPTVAEVNDATGRVRAFWVALAAQLAASTVVTVQQSTDTIDQATGALFGRVSAASAPAAVTSVGSGELPPATAAGIRLNTSTVVGTRILQGRVFVSPLALAANTNGVPSASLVAALNAAGATLLTGATGIFPLVWHRPTPGGSNGSDGAITSATGDSTKLWVLRSRRD